MQTSTAEVRSAFPNEGTQCTDHEKLVALLNKEEDHRMMSFLQIISSTLEIEAKRIPDEAATLALRRANGQIQALGVLHRLLAQPQERELFSVRRFLGELSLALEKLVFVPRDFVLLRLFDDDVDDLQVEASRMRLLALGITELLINVAKHAIDRKSDRVELAVRTTHTNLVCSVVDTGRGLSTGRQSGRSQGLGLVEALSRALNGNCRWVFTNEGTSAEITVPLYQLENHLFSIEQPSAASVLESSVLASAEQNGIEDDRPYWFPRWSQLKFLGWLGSL